MFDCSNCQFFRLKRPHIVLQLAHLIHSPLPLNRIQMFLFIDFNYLFLKLNLQLGFFFGQLVRQLAALVSLVFSLVLLFSALMRLDNQFVRQFTYLRLKDKPDY